MLHQLDHMMYYLMVWFGLCPIGCDFIMKDPWEPLDTQKTRPRIFEGPESCQRSLDGDYTSSATDFDKSRRVALGCSPHGAKHGGLGRPVILKY